MADTTPRDDRTTIFQQHTLSLSGIAYRILASRADAEDVLQEACLRWHQTDIEGAQTPEAWLVTTVTRRCIDRLRALRVEREAYIGPWLPAPLITGDSGPPDRRDELASDLSIAFLAVYIPARSMGESQVRARDVSCDTDSMAGPLLKRHHARHLGSTLCRVD